MPQLFFPSFSFVRFVYHVPFALSLPRNNELAVSPLSIRQITAGQNHTWDIIWGAVCRGLGCGVHDRQRSEVRPGGAAAARQRARQQHHAWQSEPHTMRGTDYGCSSGAPPFSLHVHIPSQLISRSFGKAHRTLHHMLRLAQLNQRLSWQFSAGKDGNRQFSFGVNNC